MPKDSAESPPTFFHIGIKKSVVFVLIKGYQNFGSKPNVSVFSFSNGTIFTSRTQTLDLRVPSEETSSTNLMKLRRAFGKPFRLLFEAKMSRGTMRSLWALLRDLLEKPKHRRCKCQILIETFRKRDNVLKNNRILQSIGVIYST